MAGSKDEKRARVVTVTFRLPGSKHRALRKAVARTGSTLQAALEKAVDELIAGTEARREKPENLRGLLSATNVMELMEADRQEELEGDRSWL